MIKPSKGTKFSLGILTFFVGVLLVWFSNGGNRERPEWVRPGFSTWGHVKNQGPEPFLKHDSNGLLPLSERVSQSRPPVGAIGEFEEWMELFLSEDSSGRGQLIEEGVVVAGRRRQEIKRLIQEDPETALVLAVPYQFRRELPPEITAQLETPVSNFAQFQLNVYCSEPGHAEDEHAGHGHAEDEYERIATFGGNRYEVYTFGRRFNVTTKDLLSIHGIAIDEVLAMADDPVRVLSELERGDRGFAASIAVAVGGNVYGASDKDAVRRLRATLGEDEGSLGPLPAAGYRALQGDEVEGVSLLFAAEPVVDIDFAGLSEMQSAPHTLGPKTMLYIRVRFSGQGEDLEPIDLATLKARQALCEAYWFENSYGKSSLTTTFTDTITLPEGLDYYVNDTYQLYNHGLPLAKAAGEAKGVDWDEANYDFYTVLTPKGNWGGKVGRAAVGGKSSQLFGPDASNVRTASHEFGHNLGLHHANYWRTDSTTPIGRDSIPGGYVGDEEGDEWIEYGHRFSVMSAQDGVGYFDEGRGHYTTGEKVQLDWLVAGDGDWMSVDQTTATPIRLYRQDVESEYFNSMIPGVVRAIKINLDSGDYAATDKRRYWLSYRLLPVYDWDDGWLSYGIQVDWQRETYGVDGSILLDMTPYTQDTRTPLTNAFSPFTVDNSDKEDSVLVVGRTYSDEVADIHFTPIARGGENPNEWIDVLINIGTQEENTAPEITSFTASSTEVAPGEMVDFSVEAEDKDGDTLYYSWTFFSPYHTFDFENLNSKTVSKSFEIPRRRNGNFIPVRVTVSDGKGGSDTKAINIIVGDLSDYPAIRGRVIAGGFPVEGAVVKLTERDERGWLKAERNAWTDEDGNYLMLHDRDSESWLTTVKEGLRLEPLFPNPVLLNDVDAWGRDWVAVGDGPASGSLQLAVTPYQSEVPISSQVDFDVLAWDASGKRTEVNPVWSVSGGEGGTISDSGVFTANESGGPFRVTATQGSSSAHAIIEVPHRIAVSIVSLTPQVSESGLEDAVFQFKRYGDTEGELTVWFEAGGSATMEEDYARLIGNVDFQDGETTVDFSVDILDDARVEPSENLVLSLRRSTDYSIIPNEASAFTEILDDADRAPAVRITSLKRRRALVPEDVGLLLETAVDDDGFPNPPGKSSLTWSVLKAPEGGVVLFSPPQGHATVATFLVPGYYKIQMTAYDGLNAGTETLDVYALAKTNPDDNPSSADAEAYLNMDEGKGIKATDSRGGDHNGYLVNGASWTGPGGGISGTGVVLDGINDKVNIRFQDGISPIFINKRTISLWFKADDPLQETKQVLYHEGDLDMGVNIYLEAGRLYVGGWFSGNNDRRESFFSTELVDTNWHHVALIESTPQIIAFNPKAFRGYLDGLEFGRGDGDLLDRSSWGYGVIAITLGGSNGKIRYHDGITIYQGDYFAGIVDEFHLWERALTDGEILQLVGQHIGKTRSPGPELALSSVDHLAGSVVIPPGMGIVLDGSSNGNSSMETKWEAVIAPKGGQAIFENSSQPSTLATFTTPGYYKLRLSVDDGIQKTAIDVDVHAGLDEGSNFSSPHEMVYLSMDEGSGNIVGNSIDGTRPGILSNPSAWTSQGGGISGTALRFDGTNQQLRIESHNSPETTAEKQSFAMWVKPNEIEIGDNETVFRFGGTQKGFNIYLDGDRLYFGNWIPTQDGTSIWKNFLNVPINRKKWSHLALVLDTDYSGLHPDGLRAYLDGKQVASGLGSRLHSYSQDFLFGGANVPGVYHNGLSSDVILPAFSGIIDEFHYYQDHALTIDEIGMLYAFGNVGPTVEAGPDQLAVPPYSIILLEGSSTDDGRWSSPVTYSWHILDGPGAGRFRPLGDNSASAQIDFFEGGTYRIALGAYDGQVTTFDELMVTVRQPTYFERYMHGFPAIAVEDRSYHADPDGDDRSNLVEYALGGAPDVGETYYQLGLQHELVREAGDWYAEFRYPRRRDAAERGLRYEFEVSDDLSTDSWTNRGYFVLAVTPIDEIFEEVHLTIADPLDSANSRIFGRVKVYLNE